MATFSRQHRWKIIGRERSTPVANIWRCPVCGLHRASRTSETGAVIIEHSREDGSVLVRGNRAVPPCLDDVYKERGNYE